MAGRRPHAGLLPVVDDAAWTTGPRLEYYRDLPVDADSRMVRSPSMMTSMANPR
jgi:hypothetical protein